MFKTSQLESEMFSHNLVPVQYVDCDGSPTETYPFNPNGSPQGN